MRNRIRLAVAVLTGSLLGMLLPMGCSETREDQSGRNLLDAVNLARRHSQRALSYMANLTIQVGAEYSPLPQKGKPLTPKDVTILPADTVNPKALEALKEAHQVLTKALTDDSDAPAAIRDSANLMLGQVESQMGDYYAAQIRHLRREILPSLTECQSLLSSIAAGVTLMKHYDGLATASEKELNSEVAKATEEGQKAATDQAAAEKEVAGQTQKVTDLMAANKQLLADASKLRIKSETTPGQGGLDLFNAALAKEVEAGQNANNAAELERTVARWQTDANAAKVLAATCKTRLEVAQRILDDRKNVQKALTAEKEKVVEQVSKFRTDLEKNAAELAKKVEEARENQAAAAKHYDATVAACKKAATVREALDAQAGADQALANVAVGLLEVNSQLATFVTDVERAFKDLNQSAPPPVAKIKESLVNVGDVCQLAAGKFQEAADLYGKAIMGVAPNLKWAYQAQKAGALAGLARFTSQADKRADAIKQATDLLAEALLRRENSPYLQETVRLKNELGRINESPLAPPSTGAPAAPTPASAPATTPS